jgi:hypothetical protein
MACPSTSYAIKAGAGKLQGNCFENCTLPPQIETIKYITNVKINAGFGKFGIIK